MSDHGLHEAFSVLKSKRVFFGHQSVGSNILRGIESLASDDSTLALTLVHLEDSTRLPISFFAERQIGENSKPNTKCADFQKILEVQLKGKVDVAIMKFCYVDITADTDVEGMFQTYCSTIDTLRAHLPSVTFVHATVPLTFGPARWKQIISRILGKTISSEVSNVKRNRYNSMVRARFAGDPIFDLESVESTYPDGSRESFSVGGKEYYSLVPAFSGDGTHLNLEGSRRAGRTLVEALAGAIARKSERN